MRTTDTQIEEIKGNKKGLKESNQTPSTKLTKVYIVTDNNFFDNYMIIAVCKTKEKAKEIKEIYIKKTLALLHKKTFINQLTWNPKYITYKEYKII